MQQTTENWTSTPVFRAGTNTINTPTQRINIINCWGTVPRLNIGNIHEIKQYWQVMDITQPLNTPIP